MPWAPIIISSCPTTSLWTCPWEDGTRITGPWATTTGWQAGAELSYVMAQGRFIPSLVGEVAAYRDRLIPADERNAGMVGINADLDSLKQAYTGT